MRSVRTPKDTGGDYFGKPAASTEGRRAQTFSFAELDNTFAIGLLNGIRNGFNTPPVQDVNFWYAVCRPDDKMKMQEDERQSA